jgi:DNA-binding response OmpR family regulator
VNPHPLRILLVDDNHGFASALCGNLEIEGFTVDVALDVPGAHRCIALHVPALIVLDIMVAGQSGGELLQALRDDGVEVPIIVVTACRDETEVLRCFALGADDFVTKPVNLPELLARIRALLRRVSPGFESKPPTIRFGDIEVYPAPRMVRRGGETVALRAKEFDLLMALLRRHDRLVSREELLMDVWGPRRMSRTVDTHIAALRRKLEPEPASPRHIITVWAFGYMLRWHAVLTSCSHGSPMRRPAVTPSERSLRAPNPVKL